jgi:hypothetical protein
MYMYYLLGHRLMELPINVKRKEVIAKNTFILALDGDIDFKPEALHLLLDLMKKDEKLGAACGRIHPVGKGTMGTYKLFKMYSAKMEAGGASETLVMTYEITWCYIQKDYSLSISATKINSRMGPVFNTTRQIAL